MPNPPDFDALYAADPDPFGVRHRWYERRKQAVVLAMLAREGYDHAWDAACGTGDLALALAARCGTVTATDASAQAVAVAGRLLKGAGNTACRVSALPQFPELGGPVDLVVLAEVLYYLPGDERRRTYAAVAAAAPQAEVAAVHWRHHPDDAYLSGQAVTDELGSALEELGWQRGSRHEDPDFVAATWLPAGRAPA